MTEDRIIEIETCTRCGGSGRYSYNQITGDRCFKCGGKGTQMTKRGRAVNDWIREQTATDALSVKVGDRVVYSNALTGRRSTFTIAEIVEHKPLKSRSYDFTAEIWIDHESRSVTLISEGGKEYGFGGAVPLSFAITDELRERARAYRDTLTMAGNPRKGVRA